MSEFVGEGKGLGEAGGFDGGEVAVVGHAEIMCQVKSEIHPSPDPILGSYFRDTE